MPSEFHAKTDAMTELSEDLALDAAMDQAIAACGGDLRATIRALIVTELMKAVSHAYARGRFHSYSG